MYFFNKLKIELTIFVVLFCSIFLYSDIDFFLYKFFSNIENADKYLYLKNFFENITGLGDSIWYFGSALLFIIVLVINNNLKFFKINNYNKKFNFCVSVIIYLALTGIITQILKHIIGRPRPNYTNLDTPFEFNFFSLESAFHSFPSGHSSTIFMVCLIFASIIPGLKYFIYFLGITIGFSRVVVGAHFITDVIAGGIIALIIFKFLNLYFTAQKKDYLFYKYNFEKNNTHLYYSIIILFILCFFVTISPDVDLYVSSLFNIGGSQFYLQSNNFLSIIFRKYLLPIILIYILILPIINIFFKIEKIYYGYKFSLKELFLIWFSQIFTILVFINLILKKFWGRARPDDTLQFDGEAVFTPWYQISNECSSTCSFVSGDASVGFSIIILYFITKNILFLYLSLILGFSLGMVRIMAGGHFLSDIFFAGLFIIILNLIIYQVYKKNYA